MQKSFQSVATLAITAFLAATMPGAGTAAAAPETQSGCAKTGRPAPKRVPLASMAITTPLLVMQTTGALFTVNLSSQVWTRISNHGFSNGMAELVPSVDGRWFSYSGTRKGNASTQYWIYDSQSKVDRLVHEHPPWGGASPEFSPDSKFLAIAASYDKRWGSDTGAGIFLLDTATWGSLPVHLPTSIAAKDAWAFTRWSRDGNELLVMRRSMAATDVFEYFSYRLSTKVVEKISGHYDRGIYDHVFTRLDREIPLAKKVRPRSMLGLSSEHSPDGTWRAFLEKENQDRTYMLNVAHRTGATKKVALGHYDHCEGRTIVITGWLDEQHLVYRDRALNYRVFETSTGNTADLFSEQEPLRIFTW